jgi:hypothetical protein
VLPNCRPPIYRVRFEGADLGRDALAALAAIGSVWEGTLYSPQKGHHHSARVRAPGPEEAIGQIRDALAQSPVYLGYRAEPLLDSTGRPWPGRIDRSWAEVEWDAPELAALSPLKRAVIWALLDDHEPTWMVLKAPGVTGSASEVHQALEELERAGLVDHRRALGLEPGVDSDEPVPWWALTNRAWDLLGLIKSPRYRP